MKSSTLIAGSFLALVCVHQAGAASTPLSLRCQTNGVYIHGAVTCQTIASSSGANLLGLAFTNTSTYDFYSPPLLAALSLVPSDKGGGVIYMQNTSASGANDFSASGRMQFFDYNPLTGTQTLMVDTTASPKKNVNHGQTVNWALPNALLPANHTIPVGHLIHIAMTIGLVAGNPGTFGQVLYNGASGASTVAYLPQNNSVVLNWPLGSVAMGPPMIVSIHVDPDPAVRLSCLGSSGGTYLIQATTNLNAPSWVTISTNVADTNGVFQVVDSFTPNCPFRFYRAVTP